jgi:hypothetical protein
MDKNGNNIQKKTRTNNCDDETRKESKNQIIYFDDVLYELLKIRLLSVRQWDRGPTINQPQKINNKSPPRVWDCK